MPDPPIRGAVHRRQQPGGDLPRCRQGAPRASMREDLFTVVHDPFLSVTARYADIVLPAATYLETEDLYRAYGTYYLQYAPAAVAPQGEAWSNFRLAQELAQRMGLDRPGVPHGAARGRWPNCCAAPAAPSPRSIWTRCAPAGRSASRREGGQEFRTPSGRLEFYSEQLAAQGLAPMPDWQPDPRGGARRGALAAAPVDRARLFPEPHRLFRRRFPAPPRGPALLHPASRRGRARAASPTARRCASSTSAARSASCCGSATRCCRASCWCPASAPTARRVAGTVNMLCSDRYTDIGEGATYQSTFLDVAAW